jgi:hypothetical protein
MGATERHAEEFFAVIESLWDDEPNPLKLSGIHACCPECQARLIKLLAGAQVEFDGDGVTKTAIIRGPTLERDRNEILINVTKVGYYYTIVAK